MKSLIKYFLLLSLLTLFSCENEPVGKDLSAEIISKDSSLFHLLKNVTTEGSNPLDEIVCIDFIYPFYLNIYNANLDIIGTKFLSSDVQFSDFLSTLPDTQSLSISYPISTTLADGTVFSVNNNEELKLAIDSCSKEDIIIYCNSLFGGCDCNASICVWKIPYTIDNDNKYATGVFESNGNGTLNFSFNGENYPGTWVFLFVNDKLHLNINLSRTSQVAQDLNIDRAIEIINGDIIITNNPKNIVLRKTCQSTINYQIGEEGPAGGIVFYDKGDYSLGWRYIEVANTDLDFFEWGCFGSFINNTNSTQIGKGFFNSVSISNYHDNLINYYNNPSVCNSLNNGTVVAKEGLLFEQNNNSDWFLPSLEELDLMYQNLYLNNLGNLSSSNYWSSTQIDEDNAMTIDFATGNNVPKTKIPAQNNIKARAIRYF